MKIFIVTERRADFSRFKPILKLIKKDKKLKYSLAVTGLHVSKKFGFTIKEIINEGFKINYKFNMFDENYYFENDGAAMTIAMSKAFNNLSRILKRDKPDLILSGFDIAANFAVTVCGAHMNIPVAHIQGGEVSGTIDESLRHAMTKFSHIHFTANNETKERLIRMGEMPKYIFPVGCPSIDALISEKLVSREKILEKFKIDILKPFTVIIQHPVTTELKKSKHQIMETIYAVKKFPIQHLVVFPNNDAGSKNILKSILKNNLNYTPTLNLSEYKTILKSCSVLIGNSSSGIHEASTFKTPVINIGTRQSGRMKPKNIINVNHNQREICKAIKKTLNINFLKGIKNLKNPYGDGSSAKKIVKILKKINLKKINIQKQITY
tara:strand:- start:502 stop:1641 length:1140 start_codon:yes stop_codon:yes gene_type:complete